MIILDFKCSSSLNSLINVANFCNNKYVLILIYDGVVFGKISDLTGNLRIHNSKIFPVQSKHKIQKQIKDKNGFFSHKF